MVEGPGCRLKGEKLKGRVKGQRVQGVSGNAVEKQTMKKKKDETGPKPMMSAFHELIGKTCIDIQTLGKEFFMFFADTSQCLRVHFLMSGGIRVNGDMLDRESKDEAAIQALTLHFNKDTVSFTNKCSVDMRNATEAQEKISQLVHLDICSPLFSHTRAVELFMEQTGRLVTDVLLDQVVLPGVGNIIKNEALFDSGVKPSSKVEELTEAHVSHLIKMTRDFTMVFYKCRRDGKSLEPFLKIYRKAKCKQCGGKVVNTRMGEDSGRLTSFCAVCQTNDLKQGNRNLPSKNSLLGWVTSPVSATNPTSQENWSCSMCTLINKYSRKSCSVCLTPRSVAEIRADHIGDNTTSSLKNRTAFHVARRHSLPDPSALNDITTNGSNCFLKITAESNFISSTVEKTFPTLEKLGEPSSKKFRKTQSIGIATSSSDEGSKKMFSGPVSGNHGINCESRYNTSGSNIQNLKNEHVRLIIPPSCKQHKKPSIMREVRKAGVNKGRMFYSCYGRDCNFFQWADENFPVCEGHGKRCVIRTVMKQGANNGRRFFACSQPKNKQCQFFTWADQYGDITIR